MLLRHLNRPRSELAAGDDASFEFALEDARSKPGGGDVGRKMKMNEKIRKQLAGHLLHHKEHGSV